MASPTRHNRVVPTGKAMAAQSHANVRRGSGTPTASSSASRQANPKASIRATAGKAYKGPDLGGGGA